MRKPLLKHIHIIRLGRFLDMLYRPAEIAEEIGVITDTVYRSYLPAGLPCLRDGKGNIWIHGPAFAAWARATVSQKRSRRIGIPEGYAWCMRCNQAVEMISPTVRNLNRSLDLLQAKCPLCGGIVNRGRAHLPPAGGGGRS
jgi:hypothetical protein